MKKWTVMIYMAGDNNLSQECVWGIQEMFKVGVNTDDIAVVVQLDPEPPDIPTYRYSIGDVHTARNTAKHKGEKARREGGADDDTFEKRGRPILITRTDRNSGRRITRTLERVASANEIIRFVKKVTQNRKYEAEHYMLVLSGHGSGAQGDALLKEGNPPSFISIARLGFALEEIRAAIGRPLDIIGFDACAMNMAEVGYQLRDSARFLVGAEGLEKNSGWPYFKILELLNEYPTIEPKELATRIVEEYVLYYSDYVVAGVSVDFAACDLSKSKELARAVKKLGKSLSSYLTDRAVEDAIIVAHWRAQSYKFEEYVDLCDFCNLLDDAIGSRRPKIREACREVRETILNRYVLKCCFSGAAFQYSHGVSICLPWSESTARKYKELQFKDTGWSKFLDEYVAQTRRRPRLARTTTPKDKELQPFSLSLESARINKPFDERVNPPLDERVNPPFDERVNPPFDERGIAMLVAKMKNPPLWFFEDECITRARRERRKR